MRRYDEWSINQRNLYSSEDVDYTPDNAYMQPMLDLRLDLNKTRNGTFFPIMRKKVQAIYAKRAEDYIAREEKNIDYIRKTVQGNKRLDVHSKIHTTGMPL